MATNRQFRCTSCEATEWAGNLFDVLEAWAKRGGPPRCAKCEHLSNLYLSFAFAFGADGRTRVVDVFAPTTETTWDTDKGHKIGFHPFLVIGEVVATGTRTAWLPYWHTDEHEGRVLRKYGQWAPHMDLEIFADLIEQAKTHNHLPFVPQAGPGAESV